VNEFGALGIDGAVLDSAGGSLGTSAGGGGDGAVGGGDGAVVVREVAGGCLCCAVAAPFTVAVTQVLRRAKPDRLLVEPSGLGHPGGIFDAFSSEHLRRHLEIRATIALVDARDVALRTEVFASEAFNDQVTCADVLVASKADVADPAHLDAFLEWAEALYPPKADVLRIANGALPIEVLDVALAPTTPLRARTPAHARAHEAARGKESEAEAERRRRVSEELVCEPIPSDDGDVSGKETKAPSAPPPPPRRAPPSPGRPARVLGGGGEGAEAYETAGWIFSRDDRFVRPRLARVFAALAAEPRVVRFKGVVRVGKEWVAPSTETKQDPETGDARVTLEPVAYRRDSRIEVIVRTEEGAAETAAGGGEGTVDDAGRAAGRRDWDALERAILDAVADPKPNANPETNE
jgi:G3E family GTPase